MLSFHGVNIALIKDSKIVTYQRDDKPGLLFRGFWDLPGGGREASESPDGCIVREVKEELNIILDPTKIVWRKPYISSHTPTMPGYFMVATLSDDDLKDIKLGSEGQQIRIMNIAEFLDHPRVIVGLKKCLKDYLFATKEYQ